MPEIIRKGPIFRVCFQNSYRVAGNGIADLDVLQFPLAPGQGLVESRRISTAHAVIDPGAIFDDLHGLVSRTAFRFIFLIYVHR